MQPCIVEGSVPAGVETDGRSWHIKKIEKGSVTLIGGGDVVGTIPAGLPSFRIPPLGLDAITAAVLRRADHRPGGLHGIHFHGQGDGGARPSSASTRTRN